MKSHKVQIRPSVSVETAVVLEILAKENKVHLGKALEDLLKESDTYKKIKESIYKSVKQ